MSTYTKIKFSLIDNTK